MTKSILQLSCALGVMIAAQIAHLDAQTEPSCEASSISLLALEPGTDGPIATFSLTPAADVQAHQLRYEYLLMGVPMTETLHVEPPDFELTLASDTGEHRFTIINNCLDGDVHTGSQLLLDLNGSALDCPVPANLQIVDYRNAVVSFEWAFNERALFWHVIYENAEGFVEEYDVGEPFVIQDLLESNFHLFTLYAVCDDQALIDQQVVKQSPAIQFMIVTVDDIKALNVGCLDLCSMVKRAYRLQCSLHGQFESNKEAFLFEHNCNCLSPAPDPIPALREIKLFPNPVSEDLSLLFRLDRRTQLSLDLLDVAGRQIRSLIRPGSFPTGRTRLDLPLPDLANGLYWIRLSDGKNFQFVRFLKG